MRQIEGLYRLALLLALLWIGYELHGLRAVVYQGPSLEDQRVLSGIEDELQKLRKAVGEYAAQHM